MRDRFAGSLIFLVQPGSVRLWSGAWTCPDPRSLCHLLLRLGWAPPQGAEGAGHDQLSACCCFVAALGLAAFALAATAHATPSRDAGRAAQMMRRASRRRGARRRRRPPCDPRCPVAAAPAAAASAPRPPSAKHRRVSCNQQHRLLLEPLRPRRLRGSGVRRPRQGCAAAGDCCTQTCTQRRCRRSPGGTCKVLGQACGPRECCSTTARAGCGEAYYCQPNATCAHQRGVLRRACSARGAVGRSDIGGGRRRLPPRRQPLPGLVELPARASARPARGPPVCRAGCRLTGTSCNSNPGLLRRRHHPTVGDLLGPGLTTAAPQPGGQHLRRPGAADGGRSTPRRTAATARRRSASRTPRHPAAASAAARPGGHRLHRPGPCCIATGDTCQFKDQLHGAPCVPGTDGTLRCKRSPPAARWRDLHRHGGSAAPDRVPVRGRAEPGLPGPSDGGVGSCPMEAPAGDGRRRLASPTRAPARARRSAARPVRGGVCRSQAVPAPGLGLHASAEPAGAGTSCVIPVGRLPAAPVRRALRTMASALHLGRHLRNGLMCLDAASTLARLGVPPATSSSTDHARRRWRSIESRALLL